MIAAEDVVVVPAIVALNLCTVGHTGGLAWFIESALIALEVEHTQDQ